MASPGLESFCCMFNWSNQSSHVHPSFIIHISAPAFHAYNMLCILSSSVSVIGALYQLWPKTPRFLPRARKDLHTFFRQNTIICWLAAADLLASIGILVRSGLWLSGHLPLKVIQEESDPNFGNYFCAVTSSWIQYFYICTYFWTLCYAIDTYRIMTNKSSKLLLFHLLSWGVSGVLCFGGLFSLYYPSLLKCEHTIGRLLPHYLSSYLPILTVMLCCPFFYYCAAMALKANLIQRGYYTDHERRILSVVTKKFLLVMLVFYVCWLPNILNGVLMIFWERMSADVLLGLWQFMALVNPVQAFLNCLVYSGSAGCNPRLHRRAFLDTEPPPTRRKNHLQNQSLTESTESAPLLANRSF